MGRRVVGVRRVAASSMALSILEAFGHTFGTLKQALRVGGLAALLVPSFRRQLVSGLVALRVASFAMRLAAPRSHRELVVNSRIAPVLASYVVAKRRIKFLPISKRAAAWDRQHAWGAERARRIVQEFGGFYTKLGQITGTAAHLMPPEWVRALGETMDRNPPAPFAQIRRAVERELGVKLEEAFERFDETPVATASVAQVHRARANGVEVAVKVSLGRSRLIMSDVRTMRESSERMKRLGLDAGLDMPSILRAYEDIVPEEFDFDLERQKIHRFNQTLERAGLGKYVAVPEPVEALSARTVLTLKWMDGPKLSDVLREPSRQLPSPNAARFGCWENVFSVLFEAWGAMIFMQREFHCDPHPANLVMCSDGRVGLLDFGQTKRFDERLARGCAEVCVAMSSGDIAKLARAIERLAEFDLVNASPATWALIAYTFFDTRWTPLADVNVYDLDRSVLSSGGFRKNSADAFPLMRVSVLMRGLMTQANVVDQSMIDAWEPYADAYLRGTTAVKAKFDIKRYLPIVAARRARRRLGAWLYTNVPDVVFRAYFGDDASFLNRLKETQRLANDKHETADLLLRPDDDDIPLGRVSN
ncbi:hypothetical protein CTAYLR_004786 [Chrysophaeum taylorii]|uniref:ABC1 atypical kinase-like domain-containing protein n=1 Tax=Chrysophaeum taylorii TaxID=2483200 RepID=A0AAD7UNH5_9STRA|nr:hypothetical protein CTAYLR_004786 [Chrysophaeum taylorii]